MSHTLLGRRLEQEDGAAEDPAESGAPSVVSLLMEPPQAEDANLSSQDSFSEDGWVPEDTSAEEPGRNLEEEAAAQKQLLAVEELVQSEKNYLRMLQVCTGTIRRNLTRIQVGELLKEPDPADH